MITESETLAGVAGFAFDAALCRWGIMFFKRPRDALVQVRQRLKPHAVLVTAVWAEPEQVPWWSMPWSILTRHAGLQPEGSKARTLFRYASSAALEEDLTASGFAVVHEEEMHTNLMQASSPEGLIDWCLAFGLEAALRGQPEAVRSAWRQDMLNEAESHREVDGMYRLGGLTRVVVAGPA